MHSDRLTPNGRGTVFHPGQYIQGHFKENKELGNGPLDAKKSGRLPPTRPPQEGERDQPARQAGGGRAAGGLKGRKMGAKASAGNGCAVQTPT